MYGSVLNPISLGSGGGNFNEGGLGGGSIQLSASGTITNNGIIAANGETSRSSSSGGGSGGTVNISVGTLAGAGEVNVNGGAIALGHPLGCSGAKLSVQLFEDMRIRKQKYGMVTACVGGGQGSIGDGRGNRAAGGRS